MKQVKDTRGGFPTGAVRSVRAYQLMLYKDSGGNKVLVWNSRARTVPYTIEIAKVTFTKTDDYLDMYAPFFVPPEGFFIIISQDREELQAETRQYIVDNWHHDQGEGWGYSDDYDTVQEALAAVMEMKEKEGALNRPVLKTVTAEMADMFQQRLAGLFNLICEDRWGIEPGVLPGPKVDE